MYKTLSLSLLLACCISAAPAWSASAIFAGGCFWCMESAYQEVPGVTEVVSGFSGGTHPNPTYQGAHTGHYEVVQVTYDAQQISYQDLLTLFWVNVDPFDDGGQFCDRGESYRTAIFVADAGERELAEATLAAVQQQFPGQGVVTPILDRAEFFPVDEGHQDYYLKNPLRYKYYRYGCGRDKRLDAVWEGSRLREQADALSTAH
ncbi:MAG: peptide-methionine (S)-S-oxide reductase MsrA [Halieaceae bacterium]